MQSNVVMVLSRSGVVQSLIEGVAAAPDRAANDSLPLTVDDFWSPDIARSVRTHLKRVILGRQCFFEQRECPALNTTIDFGYIPQGRDKVLLVARDLKAQADHLDRLEKLAYIDAATGLPNRAFLLDEFSRTLEIRARDEGRASVLCFYIGDVMDSGHALSAAQQDEVLQQLAARLVTQVRGTNEQGDSQLERVSIVARTDYRQFAIALPKIENGEDAESVAVRLIRVLGEPLSVGARTVYASPRVGVALFPQDGADSATLFDNAAMAMEDARGSSTPCHKFHSGTVRLRSLQRQDLASELSSALKRGEYTLSFLPIVDALTGDASAVEALLRWPDSLLRSQSTSEIVSVAEHTGVIVSIGEWVMREAAQQLAQWRDGGHPALRLAMNLSLQEYSRKDLPKRLTAVLQSLSLDPAAIDIEITEQVLMRDALNAYATSRQLESMGINVVVDDYGSGSCSLTSLSQSPVGAIKIDRSLVKHMSTNSRDSAACGAAAAMAKALGLGVIAEGVETLGQAKTLTCQGCTQLQGFLFGQPMPASDVPAFLADSRRRAALLAGAD